jgi:hypothetical protein
MADRTLRRYTCGLCDQRLDRMKKGALDGKGSYCSAIWLPREECSWSKRSRWEPTDE